MAPGNNGRHPNHTGTIPKTKVRNNCNVPQEAVTPTRRDMSTNMVSTSLDWVPVSEYNSRSNYSQSRKPTNNTSDHELTDIDNSAAFESGLGRFVPVRPQPRALPLNVQNRDNISDHNDDGAGSSLSGHTLHPYGHQIPNGLIPHSNHAAAAVMIVNPTTPNAVTGNISQTYNTQNQNRNNLTRNLNPARNNFEGISHASNNNTTPPVSNSRTTTKTVNLMNNMYEQAGSSFNNVNDNNHVHRDSARALGEAIVAACPDAAAVERRLGQIREYIRVTSSLVDTMRNSEDEAFIEHTKEEYDELVLMVMKLKDSENKLEQVLNDKKPDNVEVPAEEGDEMARSDAGVEITEITHETDKTVNSKNNNDNTIKNNNLKKVTNIENEQLNKSFHNSKVEDDKNATESNSQSKDVTGNVIVTELTDGEAVTSESISSNTEIKKDDEILNEILRKNIMSCVEKVARIEEMKKKDTVKADDQVSQDVTRPVSAQSNGSAYSDNELWQNEIKNKMEMSQMRLAALKQQQKRLIKYQEEAKQQLEEMNRQSQEIQPATSHDNLSGMQPQSQGGNYGHGSRMYAANQIGVATTLPHSTDVSQRTIDNDHAHSAHSIHSAQSQDERYSNREGNIASGEEAAGGPSEAEDEDETELAARGQMLQMKLRELQLKKQHMEGLVTEFQKLQMATRVPTHNTYSSSGEDSADEEPSRKCNKTTGTGGNIKNDDPFKLMEIKAIKTALQKTKDLMRSVETFEDQHLPGVHEDAFREMANHSNIHDNKSEGGGSMGGWSNDGSMCRVRNTIPQRHKFTNEQQQHPQQLQQHQQQLQQHPQQLQQHQQQLQQHQQQLQQHQQQMQQQVHQMQQHPQQMQQQLQQHPQQMQQNAAEAKIASLQELAQELRMETEKIMGERARMKDMMKDITNKELCRKQKKVNEEVRASGSGVGPAERRQMQLRAILADKQRELEALLNKEKVLHSAQEAQTLKPESQTESVVNQSYNSEQEEPDTRSEHTQLMMEPQNPRDLENIRGGGDSIPGRAMTTHHGTSNYGSDSDSVSRNKNQRNRARRRPTQERQSDESNVTQANTNQNLRHDQRPEMSNVNMVPPISQNVDNPSNMPYPHLPPPCWNNKSNQDMRTNQFTQNSHSQTMERLLGTPQMSFPPPSVPFNMMMPYGMVGGCGCGCSFWGAWCWQQLVMQQREIHQLREQLNHLEERWRAETASHTLNNQVPPGNRANNYWDNFRSYSRQNLLSANNKANADGHLGVGQFHNPHPLVERSHNPLHRTASAISPTITPKRNTNTGQQLSSGQSSQTNEEPTNRHGRRNVAYERSLSFSSAPDVLNVNQNPDEVLASHSRNEDPNIGNVSNININRQEPTSNSFRNLNITNPIPEIIQSHSNNLNTSTITKKKSSSKLPAKNSTNRRNYSLDYSQTSNINIASTSEAPNPNLASTSREVQDKATSKLFDLLKENVYSEVTALIGVNESHPDFLIQLFRELQLISSDLLRQRVLQSIRSILSQYSSIAEDLNQENDNEESRSDAVSTTSADPNNYNPHSVQNTLQNSATIQIDHKIVRFLLLKSEEYCTPEFLDMLATQILSSTSSDGRYTQQAKRRLLEMLSKYEGMRVCQISSDVIENLPIFVSSSDSEHSQHANELPESSGILQDVAGSLNLFSSSDSQLHQLNTCCDMWSGHVHMDIETGDNDNSARSSQDGKVDLINCSEMHNGDLAEADQTCPSEMDEGGNMLDEAASNAEALPDVVDTEEVTPTEAEAEWLGLDRVPTRLHMEETSEKQKD